MLSYPLISKPTGAATRDFVLKYDEDRIKMSADLGQIFTTKSIRNPVACPSPICQRKEEEDCHLYKPKVSPD